MNTRQSHDIFLSIFKGDQSNEQIRQLLTDLHHRGETPEEILGCIMALRESMIPVATPGAIDVCGTGGDGKGTFNISTAAAFVIAGAGVPVAKHGNRAATSQCGSADVLEALGVHISLTPAQAEQVYLHTGFVFLFARMYHPAMKYVAEVRTSLPFPTIFNYVGPFVHPGSVHHQLIGVSSRGVAEKLLQVAKKLRHERIMIVHSTDGLDEISTLAPTQMYDLQKSEIKIHMLDPKKFGFKHYAFPQILGATKDENARIISAILAGARGPKRDIVILNSAAALVVAGIAKTIKQAIPIAERSIDTGMARNKLRALVKETQVYA